MVLDMPRSSATFTKLGVTVPVLRQNGHLTIPVVEFSKHVPSDSTRWKQLQDAVDWDNPPLELVFLAQAVAHTSSSPTPALRCLQLLKRNVFIQMAHAVNLTPEIYLDPTMSGTATRTASSLAASSA